MKITNTTLLQAMEEHSENLALKDSIKYLNTKLGYKNQHFYSTVTTFNIVQLVSAMQMRVKQRTGSDATINMYSLALLPTGYGKNRTVDAIRLDISSKLWDTFKTHIYPEVSRANIESYIEELKGYGMQEVAAEKLENILQNVGYVSDAYDSLTTVGLKQRHEKAGVDGVGSINVIIDEIGQNLVSSEEVLRLLLELSENGRVNAKGIKTTNESIKTFYTGKSVPVNLFAFGEPSGLLNYGSTEASFEALLNSGYGRRFIFSFDADYKVKKLATPTFDEYLATTHDVTEELADLVSTVQDSLNNIINYGNINKVITFTDTAAYLHQLYIIECTNRSASFKNYETILLSEMQGRPFITMKIAAAYAVYMGSGEIESSHYVWAIGLLENSGENLNSILNRPPKYAKLAEYIIEQKRPLVETELLEALPYFKGTKAVRAELLKLARVHALSTGSILQQYIKKGVEYYTGSKLECTNILDLTASYSREITENYNPISKFSLEALERMVNRGEGQFCVHNFKDNYRKNINAIPGFNLVVLDIDGTIKLETVKFIFQDYINFIYTTKSHTEDSNRFRLILPLNYTLKLSPEDYKRFMENIYSWLFFDVDTGTNDIARTWAIPAETTSHLNLEGDTKLLDAVQFLPDTEESNKRESLAKTYEDLEPLTRWFVANTFRGNRNTMIYRYLQVVKQEYSNEIEGILTIDALAVKEKVSILNSSIQDPLTNQELNRLMAKALPR